ncbi:hypothetical protein EC957_002550 [Mortierella hygrophila]|uniref:Uncharacterized protein n=1 Tax=Mortierella hygrophila TaxID=979708 RepID=A0A9P6K1L0_9FUNG|nr:hypothetical protein EC957_002550 [Mortierella hygrophila]
MNSHPTGNSGSISDTLKGYMNEAIEQAKVLGHKAQDQFSHVMGQSHEKPTHPTQQQSDTDTFGSVTGTQHQAQANPQAGAQLGMSDPQTGAQLGMSDPQTGAQLGMSDPQTGAQLGMNNPQAGSQLGMSNQDAFSDVNQFNTQATADNAAYQAKKAAANTSYKASQTTL